MPTRDNEVTHPSISRRAFLGTAAAAASAAVLLGRPRWSAAADAPAATAPAGKPNSVINGVKIGCITYSYRPRITTAEDTLAALLKDGLSEVELMDTPIKSYTGIGGKSTDADREAQLKKCVELRKMYNDAGVNIHIQKSPFGKSDEEAEFNFMVAKALGCVAITTERDEALAKRLAPLAEKHKIYVAFHNHQNNFPSLDEHDKLLDIGKYIAFNLDIGHYVGGDQGQEPDPAHREVPRPDHQPALERQDQRGPEHALGHGQHAGQRGPAALEEREVADLR